MVTYTTSSKVAQLLQVPNFSATTSPTQTEVETIITRIEDIIERKTGHAWQTKTVTNELHNNPPIHTYRWGTGVRIFLNHRQTKTLATASGDKLEVWNGSEWNDWLTDSARTEGRENDYWQDNTTGELFLKTFSLYNRFLRIRVTYRYGESSVAGIVEDIATKMTAIELVRSDDRSVLLPEGSSNVTLFNKIEQWAKENKENLEDIEEIRIGVR